MVQISAVTSAAGSWSTLLSFVDRCKSCRDARALLDADAAADREGRRQDPFFLEVDAGDVVSRSTEEVNFRTTSFYEDYLHRSIMVIDFAGCVVPYVFFSQNWSTPFHR